MPEGHTIHRLARDHWAALRGGPVAVSSPQGRFADGAALVDGSTLRRIEAYGKHLFYWWAGGEVLHVHLGLFGKFWPSPLPAPDPKPTVRVRFIGASAAIDLTGPTDCSLGTKADRDAIVARLGPDPLRRDGGDGGIAIERWRSSHKAIGALLLDQSVIAGVGNVYRAEALFVNGIHPERLGNALSAEEGAALWATVAAMLRQGVRDNRIITVAREELTGPRTKLTRAEATYVYKREACRRCATPIARWELANRWAYACPTCQR